MTHTTVLAALATLLICMISLSAQPSATHNPKTGKPLNVLFLLADDWRYDTLSVAGNPVVKTPNIDQLAAEGIRFTHGCVTTAICGVSRASILTGQWMSRHGNQSFKAFNTPWSETYPGILRDHGYYVGHVGKWHCGAFPTKHYDFARSYNGKHWETREDGSKVHVTQKNLEDSIAFLDGRPKDKPFMLNLCFFAPHAVDGDPEQYLPQPDSMKLYQDIQIPIPPLYSDAAFHKLPPFLQSEKNEGRVRFHWRFDTAEKYQRMMKNYYRLCTEVDAVCGKIIEKLRVEGELENTLIIFMGDNGYFHGDRLLADKWYPYNESIRVPMILRDPRIPAASRGTTNDELVLNVDLAPTLLTATEMPVPKSMQGRDCSVLYLKSNQKPTPPWRAEFFYELHLPSPKTKIPASQAIVRKDIKYTLWPEWNHEEFFDITQDPLEQNNRVNDPQSQEQLNQLRQHLSKIAKDAL